MNLKFLLGSIISIPLLPIIYWQGKKIRASVPKLPPASGTTGISNSTFGSPLNIITLGESTIAGVGAKTHQEAISGSIADELSISLNRTVKWKVYAKNGYTALKTSELLVPQIIEKELDLIVVGLGGNDAFKVSSPTKWQRDCDDLILNLKSKFPETPVVFCNMPPIKEFPAFTPLIKFTIGNLVELHGEELEKLVAQYENVFYHAEIIKLEKWRKELNLDNDPKAFFSDGVHPSTLTYYNWGKDMARFILAKKLF